MDGKRIPIVTDVKMTEADQKAYQINNSARKKGITHEEMVKVYNNWADKYDNDLRPGLYNGPEIVVNALTDCLTKDKRRNLKLLDVAAGTGRVGELLLKIGFECSMDALDPAEKMLDILKSKGIYKRTWHDSIGYHQTEIPKDEYDVVLSAGAMAEGHIPVAAIDEMVRILKPGGILITIIREEYLTKIEEYTGKLEHCFQKLVNEKKIKLVSRTVVPNYSFQNNGVVYIYEALSTK
ncbi:uncharacterized protein LOC124155571 [Ischnura elegans]|uniref:uncharacterized protein LOC124155571 n=1 Tax=Ischnura elegans TaxID=197161 RepID=UPI001ED87A92|nr:uncharacterized protein LOC124155571 [Ischnura elegans]